MNDSTRTSSTTSADEVSASVIADERSRESHDGGTDDLDADVEETGAASPNRYWRFGAMIASSMTAMFALTYANTYRLGDVQWSETRFYMTFVMGAAMAVIMLGFMLGMYNNWKVNAAIVVASVLVFAGALWLVRSQSTVQDRSYMRAMIPHHSIAILTSTRADIDDVRVRELADAIIAAQKREIEEMNWLIADIDENGKATTEAEADARPVPDFGPEDYDD